MTLFQLLSERFLKRLVCALCILAFAATAFGQGPSRTTTSNRCSGEVKISVVRKTPKTPRFVGSANYVRPGGRAAWILPFNRWSNKRKRVSRKFIVR